MPFWQLEQSSDEKQRLDQLHFLISPTAFKGTLSPWQAAEIMAAAVKKMFPKAVMTILPLADGGDGTLEVLTRFFHGQPQYALVSGPLRKKVRAQWIYVKPKTALIEMARASGLALIKGKKDVMRATSYGTGQLIQSALKKGCRKIFIGVGGTACAEGGAGALRALGLRYFDRHSRGLTENIADLQQIHKVDWRDFDRRVRSTEIVVLCDVKNPLLGPKGSARTYGPQKGATHQQVRQIERALKIWASHANKKDTRFLPGAGAAGALAFGLAGFAGAHIKDGMSWIMHKTHWEKAAKKADVILTGEGRLDKTSFAGKVVGAIGRYSQRRKNRKAAVIAICGSLGTSEKFAKRNGISLVQYMGAQGLKHPRQALRLASERALSKFIDSKLQVRRVCVTSPKGIIHGNN